MSSPRPWTGSMGGFVQPAKGLWSISLGGSHRTDVRDQVHAGCDTRLGRRLSDRLHDGMWLGSVRELISAMLLETDLS
jgi:hypothetical protein